jgi:hypothetical protein
MTDDNARPPADSAPTGGNGGPVGWLIPAVTFLVGLVLGGLVIGLLRSDFGDGDGSAAGTTPSTASATPAPSTSLAEPITIPGECVQIASDSQQLLDLVDQAVTAARDLDAEQLSSIVSQLQDQQQRVRDQAAACQQAATTSATPAAG